MRLKGFFLGAVLFLFLALPLWALDPNRASVEELAALPGIGRGLARRIVEYRRQHGPFRSPEDLLKVKGIGPRRLERLRPYLEFPESPPSGMKVSAGEASPAPGRSYIYRWVDEKGVVHFTEFPEEIPPRFRSRAERIPFPAGSPRAEAPPAPSPETPGPAREPSRPKTDILGRDLKWYREEVLRLVKERDRLRRQIEENRQAMRLLHGGSPIARRGTRTEYGIKLGQGPILRRWAEYKRLRRINQELEKRLSEVEYRLRKGLYREALRTYAPEEVLRYLKEVRKRLK
ncbi:DUF4124 domain-containing protein [Thermosulfurimonas marina]|uniref:DUF4124 domain-containing protein n=1 Tax=Thermosulfurimonas marina TaxID=2047767 RepID=A0A6H1WU42_9BACT|nr:helix-hairpin-helix domain-containing protein [Thermosulfurimonas marina]QJA06669.1 DUF4124 domain-containing protein [Thermosulfurimonas marina]